MQFNQTTHHLSLGILVLTILYTLVYGGLTGLLLCSAVALLIAAFVETFELIAAGTVLFVLFYVFFLKRHLKRYEPFTTQSDEIMGRIASMSAPKASKAPKEPSGVYDSAIEGFQDLQPDVPKDGAASESSAAGTQEVSNQVDESHVEAVSQGVGQASKDIEAEETQSATGALFKKGQMPSEDRDGPKLDAGKTIMKAMKSFDPDTIKSMTSDTQQLVKTQENLMDMLTQMRPVLSEGHQLLQTFQGMFGGGKFTL